MAKAKKAAPAGLATTNISMIEFSRLVRAPENVRHQVEHDDLVELATDIRGHGLLQSLIGYEDTPDGVTTSAGPFVYVVGGGRRLAALHLLHEDELIGDAYLVPVSLRSRDEAVELSLAENLARREMSPVDEFQAFKQLMDLHPGEIGVTELAKRFGFTERHVKQRMRLAGLHELVLDALAERTITLDAAMAYASTSDLKIQERVFKDHSRPNAWKPHDPIRIRQDIGGKRVTTECNLVRYVGAAAYEKAGGTYEDDLFNEAGELKVLKDAALLRSLCKEKIERAAPKLIEAEKLTDIVIAPEIDVSDWQWKKPKAPDGFVQVDAVYSGEKRWNAALNCGAKIVGVLGIDQSGAVAVVKSLFFVDKEKAKEVVPPEPAREVYRQPTEEEMRERRRQGEIETWSRRLALGGFADTKFAGRAFWQQPYNTQTERFTHSELGEGYVVHVRLFVTAADAEAQMEAAAVQYDEETKRATEAKVERERAKQEAEEAAATAAKAKYDEMIATPPAVIADASDMTVWHRQTDGSYQDAPEGSEASFEAGYDSLGELLDNCDVHTLATFGSVAEFEAWAAEDQAEDQADAGAWSELEDAA